MIHKIGPAIPLFLEVEVDEYNRIRDKYQENFSSDNNNPSNNKISILH